MPVSLSELSWQTPDRAPLFTGLTLTFGDERTGLVGRNGTGKSTLLRLVASEIAPHAGRIHVSGKTAYLPQVPRSAEDDRLVDLFGARAALAALDRAAAGLASAEDLAEADWTLPARIEAAMARLGLCAGLSTPLSSLSGGQRTRAALAALLIFRPDFLLLNEPTNNLDAEGRAVVLDLLRGWKGGAIVVSHDRELLECMDAVVELSGLGAMRYGGGYSAYRARKAVELAAARHDLAEAERADALAERRAQQAAERKAKKDAGGAKARGRGDQPKVMLDFAKGRAEASGGAGARLRDARKAEAAQALAEARERVEVVEPIRMSVPPTGLAAGRTVLRLAGLGAGYGGVPLVEGLSLEMTGPERLVIAGANGSGKSTLIKVITGALAALSGEAAILVPWALLDQHVSLLEDGETLRESYLRLNPEAGANAAHAALARFGFRASDAGRTAGTLSGGERLRAGLACTLGGTPIPMLMILDEPTNHLDLDGIAALEAALEAYDGAILAVSHDAGFLAALKPDRTVDLPRRQAPA